MILHTKKKKNGNYFTKWIITYENLSNKQRENMQWLQILVKYFVFFFL